MTGQRHGLGIVVPRPCSIVIIEASCLSAFSVRPNVVSASSGLNRCRAIALAKVNSLSPSGPWIRPKPESPTPPKGSDGMAAKVITPLTAVMPERMREASSMPRAFEKTVEPRP